MTFGQRQGVPASAAQMRDLVERLHEAGHRDFRDARGPMGFTQRQAGGKFTRDEADDVIARLESAADNEHGDAAAATAPSPHVSAAEHVLRRMDAAPLAAELRRRGWTVNPPERAGSGHGARSAE